MSKLRQSEKQESIPEPYNRQYNLNPCSLQEGVALIIKIK
jgi:hypothetical protein